MMKILKYGLPAIILLVFIFGWRRSPQPSLTANRPSTPEAKSIGGQPVSPKIQSPVATLPTAVQVKATAVTPSIELDPELKTQLTTFHDLQIKILKNEEDQKSWASLLKNPHAIYRARKLLLSVSREHSELQNQAMEFLIEAAKTGDPNALGAAEALVADSTIESESIDKATRQFKAEIKANLLYELTSAQPKNESRLSSLLPGPVSQRIWKNVLAQQANNIEESQLRP